MAAFDRRQADRESIALYIRLLIFDALAADLALDANTEAARLAARFAASGWNEADIVVLLVEHAKLAGAAVKVS